MLVEMTEYLGRQLYSPDARLVGEIDNVVVDVEQAKIDGLYLENANPALVEEGRPVNVPYRWVSAVNDVVLLKYFPKRVSVKKGAKTEVEEPTPPTTP